MRSEGTPRKASHRVVSPTAHRRVRTPPRLPALRSPRGSRELVTQRGPARGRHKIRAISRGCLKNKSEVTRAGLDRARIATKINVWLWETMSGPRDSSPSREVAPVLQWGSLIIGILYFNGFYINAIFTANYGIFHSELLRLDYIKIGFMFSLLTLGIVFIPFGIAYLVWKVRSASDIPNLYFGFVGNTVNVLLFFSLPVFLACFATADDWYAPLRVEVGPLKDIEAGTLAYVAITAFGTAVVPAVERFIFKHFLRRDGSHFTVIVEPMRFLPTAVSLFLLWDVLSSMDWISALVRGGLYYLSVAILFVVGVIAAGLWFRKVRTIRGSAVLMYALVGFGLCVLYYLSVTTYVFGVYKFIPNNRGGALPVTEMFIDIDGPEFVPHAAQASKTDLGYGPFYLIEDNEDYLFFAFDKLENWNIGFVPVYALSKDKVAHIYIRRISNGLPRAEKSKK